MKRSWWIGAVVGVVVLLGAWWGYARLKKPPAPKFETAVVTRERVVAKVTASGTLSALVTVQVGSQVSGRIQELDADFNSSVKKGDVLAKIDPQLFEAAVEQAKANLTAADGNLEKAKVQAVDAKRQLERSKQLREQNLIAQADLDTAEANAGAAAAQVKTAEGAVAQATASLHQAQTNLAYTTIHSPINGTVISRNVDVGQTVAAALSAPTLFTIAEDLQKMQVDTSVAEADVGKLKAGMKASFFVDAYPNRRFDGTVRQIRNAATTVQNVVTYDAVIDVGNPDLALKPGMTATVTFIYAERDDALTIPNAALRFHPPASMTGGASGRGRRGAGGNGNGAAVSRADEAGPGRETPAPTAVAENERRGGPRAARTDATGGTASESANGNGSANANASANGNGNGEGEAPAGGSHGRTRERAPDEREIWVLSGERPHPVTIRVGVTDGTRTEVVEGNLHVGDKVVTGMSGGANGSGQNFRSRRMF